jgi:hypothetical protein
VGALIAPASGSGHISLLVAVLLCIITPLQLMLRRRVQRLDSAFGEGL